MPFLQFDQGESYVSDTATCLIQACTKERDILFASYTNEGILYRKCDSFFFTLQLVSKPLTQKKEEAPAVKSQQPSQYNACK